MPRLAPSERKFLTVLFADIQGSLGLIHGRDPEIAASLLASYVNLMIQAIQAFGGTVNRVMGDGVMALFGAPRATEHHALRACLSALRIRDGIAGTGKSVEPAVEIRVGMASGEAVVKPMVAHDFVGYDADGEIVHLASRMEQLANPGAILMTPRTARLVSRDMSVRALGPVGIKGLPTRMDVYELLQPRPAGHVVGLRFATPAFALVGRDREVAAILNARDQAASGLGRVIGISGDAGCGKSRILAATIIRDPGDWVVLMGHAAAYDQKGYRLVLNILAGLFRLDAHDSAEKVREKIRDHLSLHGLIDLLPALTSLHQVDPDDLNWRALGPVEKGRRMQQAVLRLLETMSETSKLAIIAEDLHWADSESVALLESLAGHVAARSILFIATSRPEWQAPWARLPDYVALLLDPLTDLQARKFLTGHVIDGPGVQEFQRILIERTGGNPLFLEEMLTKLADEGVLVRAGERYRLVSRQIPEGLPDSIRGLLADRIDRLPRREKDLLQVAAVIGQTFTLPLLENIAGDTRINVRSVCQTLCDNGFLSELDTPERSYRFRHALVCDAAYSGLLHRRRQQIHGRIVDAITEIYPRRLDTHVEALAHHAARALRWSLGVRFAVQAADQAASRDASADAAGFYERALEWLRYCNDDAGRNDDAARNDDTGRIDREIEIRLAIRDPLFRLGRLADIIRHIGHVEGLLSGQANEPRFGMMLVLKAHVLTLTGRHQESLEATARALQIADAHDDGALRARARFQHGFTQFIRYDYAGSASSLSGALDFISLNPGETRHGLNRGIEVAALSYRTRARVAMGDLYGAMADLPRMVDLAEKHASPFEWAFTCLAAAELSEATRDLRCAAEWLGRGLKWSDQAGAPLLGASTAVRLAHIQTISGSPALAVERLKQTLLSIESMGYHNELPAGLAAMAEATYETGELDIARATAVRARTLGLKVGDLGAVSLAVLILGRCLAREGRTRAARQRFQEAMQLSVRAGKAQLIELCGHELNNHHVVPRRRTAKP